MIKTSCRQLLNYCTIGTFFFNLKLNILAGCLFTKKSKLKEQLDSTQKQDEVLRSLLNRISSFKVNNTIVTNIFTQGEGYFRFYNCQLAVELTNIKQRFTKFASSMNKSTKAYLFVILTIIL